VKRECEEEIKEKLFAFAWPHIARMSTRGLPEWYKELLLKKQFEVPIEKGKTFNHRDGQAELDKFQTPDRNCITLGDGSCSGENCIHDF
jgi:hypothetical protein